MVNGSAPIIHVLSQLLLVLIVFKSKPTTIMKMPYVRYLKKAEILEKVSDIFTWVCYLSLSPYTASKI